MEEKNELNDIILNKGNSNSSNKKILLAIASLAIVLIIVVVIMNRLNSNDNSNLPGAILPPEPTQSAQVEEDPLFEPVNVEEEVINDNTENSNVDEIAQKLKEESVGDIEDEDEDEDVVEETIDAPPPISKPKVISKHVEPKRVTTKKLTPKAHKSVLVAKKGIYYIQVGSFSKYKPDQKFLGKIKNAGFEYSFKKLHTNGKVISKVLIGPFNSDKEARSALKKVRSKIERGAFLTKG